MRTGAVSVLLARIFREVIILNDWMAAFQWFIALIGKWLF